MSGPYPAAESGRSVTLHSRPENAVMLPEHGPTAPPSESTWQTAIAALEAEISNVPLDDVPELAGRLEALKLRLVLRLQAPRVAIVAKGPDDDRLLDADAAAALLGVKPSWIYDHAADLSPVKLPGRVLRFSESRLRRWLQRRA